MRSEAWRWSKDEDGWLFRPALSRDDSIPHTGKYFGKGWNAFVMDGNIYCRNASQRRRIDLGLVPTSSEGAGE